ncbi:MAG: hypothetical protein V2A67_01080 [Bacteroidota bacterium]
MKHLLRYGIVCMTALLVTSCVFEEGNPDLSGSWTCTETSEIFLKNTKGTSIYQVTFEKDASIQDKYYINNFYKLGNNIHVSVIKSGYTISLPKQSVNGFVFEGSGETNDTYDMIYMTYTADDGGGEVDHVTAEYAR